MFRTLRARLSVIFIGFLLLVAASVLATVWAVQAQTADATVINLAGRPDGIYQYTSFNGRCSVTVMLIPNRKAKFDGRPPGPGKSVQRPPSPAGVCFSRRPLTRPAATLSRSRRRGG